MACGEERLVSNFTTKIANFPTLIFFSFFRFLCLSLKQT